MTFTLTGRNPARRRSAPLPKNYRLIYEIVEKSGLGRHLTSSEIYAKALKRRPGIGFSTVYRGLERLRDLGLVSELHVPGLDAATYEPSGPRHAHFRCNACGTVEDVAYAIPVRTLKSLAQQHKFTIESERVTFEGRCAACRVRLPDLGRGRKQGKVEGSRPRPQSRRKPRRFAGYGTIPTTETIA